VYKVILRVFSGRPNPCWYVENKEMPDFSLFLRELSHQSSPIEIPERLGYSGFIVSNNDATTQWTEIIVFHELVICRLKNHTKYYLDNDYKCEKVLIDLARGQVNDILLERIRSGQPLM